MPRCKNDETSSYKGDEPSPKGLGYCAHAEKIGTVKKGKDGNKWRVEKTMTGARRWVKYNKVATKAKAKTKTKKSKTKTKSRRSRVKYVKPDLIEGPNVKIDGPKKVYFTHDNGGRAFKVVIQKGKGDKKIVHVIPVKYADDIYETHYPKIFKSFNIEKVYVGKDSGKSSGSDIGGMNTRGFDGNSILLKVKGNEYIFIGWDMYQFKLNDRDELVKYFSLVGNNDVPYPVLLGKDNVYFMNDRKYVPREYFPLDIGMREYEDAYTYYFGIKNGKVYTLHPLKERAKKMKGLKQLHKRPGW